MAFEYDGQARGSIAVGADGHGDRLTS